MKKQIFIFIFAIAILLSSNQAIAAIGKGDWAELTGKDKALELRIEALENENANLKIRVFALEKQGTETKGLIEQVFNLLKVLNGLIVNLLQTLKARI